MLLGIHVSKTNEVFESKAAKDISDAIERDTKMLGINAVQIFTYGPKMPIPNKIDIDAVKEKTTDIDLSVHSAYTSTGIWKVNNENKTSGDSKKRLGSIEGQIKSCQSIGAWGWVLHIAKTYPDVAAETMSIIKPIAKKYNVILLLEMVASKADPNKTYETPEKIDNLTTLIGPTENWWGWCVDTAHLWGAGIDVKSYASMKKWLDSVTYKHKILMFHLNGSSAIRGSGKDKHEIAFGRDDLIWYGIKPQDSGVRAIVEFALAHNITIICEINRGNKKDYIASLNAIKTLGDL